MEVNHKLWRCTVCDYIYDVDEGDPENFILLGMSFKSLPGYLVLQGYKGQV